MIKIINKIKKIYFLNLLVKILKRIKNEFIGLLYKLKILNFFYNKYIDLETFNSQIVHFFNLKNKNYYLNYLEKNRLYENIINTANKICSHNFNILSFEEVYFGEDIDWNKDFNSKFVWKNKYFKTIRIIDLKNNADVKTVWELSRFHHAVTLGQAYFISDDIKYYNEFKYEIIDWIEKNPYKMSINWTCSMEVAIRACNWITSIGYFENKIDNFLKRQIDKSLFLHGKFIINNLEKEEISNNHYLSNLIGLYWIGLYFKGCKYKHISDSWIEFAKSELEKEICNQVYEDGCLYEGSTYYHCFVTELFLFMLILSEKNNDKFSDKFKITVEKMCEVIMNITKPNGFIPLIGDMDSGRFIVFSHYDSVEKRDFRYLLNVAGLFFNRDDFISNSLDTSTSIWMFSKIKNNIIKKSNLKSVSYPYGGWHILRNDNLYLIINCRNSNIRGKGGHIHDDQLSIEINIYGHDLIIDSGTFTYTSDPKMRNIFRNSLQHSIFSIKNIEKDNFVQSNLFAMIDKSYPKVLCFDNSYFKGEKTIYIYNNSFSINREIILGKNSIKIIDYLYCEDHNLEKISSYILDDSINLYENDIFLPNGKKINFNFKNGNFHNKSVKDIFISKGYGMKSGSKKIFLEFYDNSVELDIKF